MRLAKVDSWILISGASTGIGRATALKLVAEGYSVIAGVRRQTDADALTAEATKVTCSKVPGKLVPVPLDVTEKASIKQAVSRTEELTAGKGLLSVINNAGIVVPGPVEFVSANDWRRQFDVNFFGMVELTRATLPLLRRGVSTHGIHVPRLMFVSSIGGRVSQPILTPYTCSKFATNALGDGLRLELRRQGIGVTLIEPGAISTDIWNKGNAASSEFSADHPARPLYGPEIDGLIQASRKAAKAAIPAAQAAQDIFRALIAYRAPARVLVGTQAKILAILRNWLPLSWFDSILMREFRLAGRLVQSVEAQ